MTAPDLDVERLTSLLAYARESRDAYAAEVERLRVERDQARKERDRAREATIARVREAIERIYS